jgi:hypothetical protein
MKFPVYLGMLHRGEQTLAAAFRQVADGHGSEPDVYWICRSLADNSDRHVAALAPVVQRYGEVDADDEPERLHAQGLSETRSGPLGLLRDLQDLHLLATMVDLTWSMTKQVAQGLRDEELLQIVGNCQKETAVQLGWLTTRMSTAAPQALIVAS